MRDALETMINGENRVIRVMGEPVKGAGLLIDVTLSEKPLREAMVAYGLNILRLSFVISITTAIVLFFAVRWLMVRPIKRMIGQIQYFQDSPQDQSRIIVPQERVRELRLAENALQEMETNLSQSLRQKERLAALGSAVSKISHDLRNMLTTATLLADTMERSDDPRVKRSAPKLVGSLTRAVNLCETTLAFGKAEEAEPEIQSFDLAPFLQDVAESERLASDQEKISIVIADTKTSKIEGDEDQMFRVVSNLVRNARQVLEARKEPGIITVTGGESETDWEITVSDNGPGLPPKALEKLFTPFEGGVRRGGSGLGLAISAELVAGHGGALELLESNGDGATFIIKLPKTKEAA
jgi:signal transduction histidine kinase